MEDIRQYVIDYLEGRVPSKEFIKELQKDTKITDWLQTLVPEGEMRTIVDGYDEAGHTRFKKIPYIVSEGIACDLYERAGMLIGRELNVFSRISILVKHAFPELEIVLDNTLDNQFNFLLDACPEYLSSIEISSSGILDELMEELPEDMPKTKRIKQFKERLKAMFYVEGQKYPRWIQESEWPLSKTGKPTKFLRQKHKGEVSYYYFLDMDTNEEIEIMQAF